MHKFDIKAALEDYPLHVLESSKLGNNLRIVSEVDHIVIAGMGHSAIVGEIVKSLLKKDPVQVSVISDYILPQNVNSKTLVFALSYSGDTDETISMYSDALKKKAKVVVVSSGGKISYLVRESNAKYIRVPSGLVGRCSLMLLLFPVLNIITNNKLTSQKLIDPDELSNVLRSRLWKEKAKQIADKLHDTIPLIYTTNKLVGVAKRWKYMFNENSKIHAFYSTLPDWCHNELQGFELLNGNYHAILIEDEKDSIRNKKVTFAAKAFFKENNIPLTELIVRGKSLLSKTISAVYLGDWISYYLALKNKVDPGHLPLRDDFKKRL